jgi:hypothetical protein
VEKLRELQRSGSHEEAERLSVALGIEEHGDPSSLADIFRGRNLRTTLSLGRGHVLNYFPVQVFSVLGTTVLVNVHHVFFTNSLAILLMSNLIAYLGYRTHGFLGGQVRTAQHDRLQLDHGRHCLHRDDLRAEQLLDGCAALQDRDLLHHRLVLLRVVLRRARATRPASAAVARPSWPLSAPSAQSSPVLSPPQC